LVDDAGGRFQIVGNQLQVKNASLLDFEQGHSYTITVQTTDQGGLSTQQPFAITLTNANEAPFLINLSNLSVGENAAPGTVIGLLSTTDPDAGDSHTYSLLENADGRFQVVGNQIQVLDGSRFDLTQSASHIITVQVTDAEGLSTTQQFTIALTDTTAPVLSLALGNDTAANTQ
jgi:hypothetical protein